MPIRLGMSPARRVPRSPAGSGAATSPAVLLLVFAIANVGGVLGYLPLLSLLLPMKIEAIAGNDRLGVFTATIIAGASAASLSNIVFGWLSDLWVGRPGGRRLWLAVGLIATALSFAAVARASTPATIVIAIMLFQTAVNALLAPLFAIMAEEVPDTRKGLAGGLLALGNPVASAMSALMIAAGMLGEADRLAIVALVMAACILPLLLRPARVAVAGTRPRTDAAMLRRDLVIAWAARLLIQVAGNVLSLYLLYYFESVTAGMPSALLAPRVGQLLTIAYVIPLPIAVLVGRLSDWTGQRKPFLLAAASVAAAGLLGMALAEDWGIAAIGFVLYATGSAVFLALHSTFAMQLLPDPRHRGRDLGLLNLTNTLPALAGPLITWLLATPRDFDEVMLTLAALSLCGGLAILAVRGRH